MSEPLRSHTSTTSRLRITLTALAVFVFAACLYLPSLKNGFVWDDKALVENPDIRTLNGDTVKRVFTTNYWDATDVTSGLYRPLTALSFHADYQTHADKPAGFHLTNVLFNAAVCALLFLVLVEMFAALDLALFAALFFAAFPMHVENVAWVSGRTDLLATMFMLASLWWTGARKGALIGAAFFFIAALLSKETAIVLPAVVLVSTLLSAHREPSARRRGIILTTVLFVIALLYLVLRKQVLGASVGYFHRFTHGFEQAVALPFSILAHYTYKLVFPFRPNAESDFPPPAHFWNVHVLVGVAIFAGICYALWRWRGNRVFVFGTAVIAIGLLPVLNILPLNQILAERFLYFPSTGFALLVALLVITLRRRWRLPATVVFVLLLAVCSARTVTRTADWKDELTLFQKSVAASPDNARARASLGSTLYDLERYDEALNEFRHAVRVNPSYAPGWSGLARTEGKLGHLKEAMDAINNALDIDPDNAVYYNSLGMLQFQARDYMNAVGSFREVLQIRPRHLHARFNLGLALYQLGDFEGAVKEFTELENKDGDFQNAWFFLAESQLRAGNAEAAAESARHFLAVHSQDDAMASRAREIAGGTAH
ncbi:MAG TPA: tetratricopeptide repeat protein [Candidatus Krumholzibacteria bacterium]|nr:tetratricopeptide repeat protein [Candidatus Krumholzibacteria bacterium]